MAYTTIDDPSVYFQTTLYTGNGTDDTAITHGGNSDIQANWIWIKNITAGGEGHHWYDSVRGVTKRIRSDTNAAETTVNDGLKSFDSDGFTVDDRAGVNQNTKLIISWNWKAGTALNNSAGSNNGSIASTGSFSTAAGFSIVKWSGSNSAGTIYTGLSGKIDFVILKNLSTTRNWIVKPKSFAANDVLYLQTTGATVNAPGDGWINALTATNGTIGLVAGGSNTNPLKNVNENNANYIAYCFQEKKGYSKFDSFIGTGNVQGTFCFTGFKVGFLMIKDTQNASGEWLMWDNKRSPHNEMKNGVAANDSLVQDTTKEMDFTAQGFKIRTTDTNYNSSGHKMIYMAFAESPFVTSTGIPATAR